MTPRAPDPPGPGRHPRALGLVRALAILGALGAGIVLAVLWAASQRDAVGLARARELTAAGRFEDARPWLEARVQARRPNPEVFYLLGLCEHARGAFAAAEAAWARVEPGSSFASKAELARAQTLAGDLGRWGDAEAVLDAARRRRTPEASVARYALSQLYFYEGRLAEMRRLLEEGWSRSTDRAGDLRDHWRADAAAIALDHVRAEVDNARRLAPDDHRVRLATAYLATLTGQREQARSLLAMLERERPHDPVVARAQLQWARAFDDPAAARRALERIPDALLEPAEALEFQAWLAAREGRRDAQREALEHLVALRPGSTEALEQLAVLAAEAGRTEAANRLRALKARADDAGERYMRQLEDGGPLTRPQQFAELAGLAESLGRDFEAKGWWTLALLGDRGNATYAESLARLERRRAETGVRVEPARPRSHALASEASAPADDAGPPPRFVDRAEAAGLRFRHDNGRSRLRQLPETSGGGVGLLDLDGDGKLDVYLVQGGAFPPAPGSRGGDRLFRNRGDGTFEDVSERSGIAALAHGYGHGVAVGDVDADGHPDLFLTRWRAYVLLRNRGDGGFEDVTERWGLGGDRDWPTSAALADLDGDGDLDLYVCHYAEWDEHHPRVCPRQSEGVPPIADDGSPNDYCNPNPFPARPDHLFRNDGGRFVDVSDAAGITAADRDGRGFGVVAADVDDDGLLDLFVANDTTANYLFHNRGGMSFEEVGLASGVATGTSGGYQAGMGVACGDLDRDGRFDLLVTNFYGESTTFYHNLGGGWFTDRSAAIGLAAPSRFLLGFGIALLDFNNDGRLDLATTNGHVNDLRPRFPLAMPMLLLGGTEGGRLVDVTTAAGADMTLPRIGRALAASDLDDDGRVDLLTVSHDRPVALLHNETPAGRSLSLYLEAADTHRDAIGAIVAVWAGGARQVAQRTAGGGFQSSGDPRLHFGLGSSPRADSVQIAWPSGRMQRLGPLLAGIHRIREGASENGPAGR